MTEKPNTYRQVLKATSLFGGVQVFNIIISIIRSKAIALLIGTAGMGVASLLMTTLNMVNGFTNFGLDRSAVRDVSMAKESGDVSRIQKTVSILHRLIWITALLGAFVLIVLSPFLSEIAFESREYTLAFIWISLALIFKQLTSGRLVILQGLRHLKSLATANLVGNSIALLITLPLYYFFQLKGIVPAIILSTAVVFFVTYFYSYKKLKTVSVTTNEAFRDGKNMITLGLTLSFGTMITLLTAYVLQIFISARGGVDEVGLYSAGFIILNSYVGLIFTAMSTDYYPRLAAISEDIKKIKKTVYEQAFIAILLITPIVVIFLTFAPFIIRILYSEAFDPIIGMVTWGILGMVFKAVSFSMGYIIIAKGDSKLFMTTAVVFNALLLTANVVGYVYGGLTGLGISFFLYYIVHFLAIKVITQMRYGFTFPPSFYGLFAFCFVLCLGTFLLTFIESVYLKYALMILLIVIACGFSIFQLNKKLNLKESISNFLNRKK